MKSWTGHFIRIDWFAQEAIRQTNVCMNEFIKSVWHDEQENSGLQCHISKLEFKLHELEIKLEWYTTYSVWLSKDVEINQQSILDALLPLHEEYFFIWNLFLQTSFNLCCCINCCISIIPISAELTQLRQSRFGAQLKSPPSKVSVVGSSQLFASEWIRNQCTVKHLI